MTAAARGATAADIASNTPRTWGRGEDSVRVRVCAQLHARREARLLRRCDALNRRRFSVPAQPAPRYARATMSRFGRSTRARARAHDLKPSWRACRCRAAMSRSNVTRFYSSCAAPPSPPH
jgi:hypothetical protein